MPDTVPSEDFSHLSEAVLLAGGSLRFRANGGSMRPFLRDGDILTVAPPRGKYQAGDILLARLEINHLVAHRVLRAQTLPEGGTRYLLKGDARLTADGWIPPEQILGRVISAERGGKTIRFTRARCLIELMLSQVMWGARKMKHKE